MPIISISQREELRSYGIRNELETLTMAEVRWPEEQYTVMYFSQWDDESDWVLDAAFNGSPMPVFSHGDGARPGAFHLAPPDLAEKIDAAYARHIS